MPHRTKYRTITLLATIFFVLVTTLVGVAQDKNPPKFEQFRTPVSKMKPKTPKLSSHKDARVFRTNLRKAVKNGINFAGHFVLAFWGHGVSNVVASITDAKTGAVFFPKQLFNFWSDEWPATGIPFRFRANSRLLVMKGYESNDYLGRRKTYGFHYYEWTGTKLREIKFSKIHSENNGN